MSWQRGSSRQWSLGNESIDGGNYSDVEREGDFCTRMYSTIPYSTMYTAADGGVGNSRLNRDNMRQASETRRTNFTGSVTVLSSLPIITRPRFSPLRQWSASLRR